MLMLENFYRRIAYCVGVALLITFGFRHNESMFYLPTITWIVMLLLFVSSWRVQKEYKAIIERVDGVDAKPNDPVFWAIGDKPRLYYLVWSAVYTFGTYIVVAIPLDWFVEGTKAWRPIFVLWLVILFVFARLVDPKVRKSFYNKKS